MNRRILHSFPCHEEIHFLNVTTVTLNVNQLPCRMRAPMPNQKLLSRVKLFCMSVEEGLHGCGLYHSYGVNLQHKNNKEIGNGAQIQPTHPPTHRCSSQTRKE